CSSNPWSAIPATAAPSCFLPPHCHWPDAAAKPRPPQASSARNIRNTGTTPSSSSGYHGRVAPHTARRSSRSSKKSAPLAWPIDLFYQFADEPYQARLLDMVGGQV